MSDHSPLWHALDALDAPWFTALPCSTCRVSAGEYCISSPGRAHQSRIDAGMREANRKLHTKEA